MKRGQYSRDITLSGTTADSFVAPYTGEYWFYNPPTNHTVTLGKIGRGTQTIAAGEVAVIHLEHGEEASLVGTASETISVYDKFDVKLIPSGKDVLGTVKIGDGTNTAAVSSGLQLANQPGLNVHVDGGDTVTISPAVASVFTVAGANVTLTQNADNSLKVGGSTTVLTQDASNNLNVNVNAAASTLKVAINNTGLVASGTLSPTSIANGTAETVKVTGSISIATTVLCRCNLACAGTVLATTTDDLTYVAIKGATSGIYYAVAYLDQAIAAMFSTSGGEKLNIVVRNQDTVSHSMSAYWAATN